MNHTLNLKITGILVFLVVTLAASLFAQEEVSIIDLRKGVHKHANEYRESLTLNRLIAKSGLNRLAQGHAANMAAGKVPFSHQGFNQRYKEAKAYFKRGITMAENVYYSNYPADQIAEGAVQGWIESPGHNRNLKGKFRYTGIGVAKTEDGTYYVVQLYAD